MISVKYYIGMLPTWNRGIVTQELIDHYDNMLLRLMVYAEARKFDGERVTSWAVCDGQTTLNKKTMNFEYESLPSSRTDEYLNEYRFATIEEAKKCFDQFCEEVKVAVRDKFENHTWRIVNDKLVLCSE